MHGFKQADAITAQRGGRQEANRAGEHRGFVGEDVAEEVASHDDVKLARVAHELHRRVIDQQMGQRNVGVVGGDGFDGFPPQL